MLEMHIEQHGQLVEEAEMSSCISVHSICLPGIQAALYKWPLFGNLQHTAMPTHERKVTTPPAKKLGPDCCLCWQTGSSSSARGLTACLPRAAATSSYGTTSASAVFRASGRASEIRVRVACLHLHASFISREQVR